MSTIPFILVIISTFTHAYWNYLVKRSENKHIFTALSKLSEIVIFAIPAFYFLSFINFEQGFVFFVVIASFFTFLNYFFLASAYKHGDLSILYPVSRSSILFLPILAFIFIGEKIDGVGVAAIVLILVGTLVMHLDSFDARGIASLKTNLKNRGSFYAIMAALSAAGYTLWNKISVSSIHPFLFFYFYTLCIAILYGVFMVLKFPHEMVRQEWHNNKNRIVQVGFFNSFTSILILLALTMSKATYVGGMRQLSIVVGAFLGYRLLQEKMTAPKIFGILVSILGGFLLYLAK